MGVKVSILVPIYGTEKYIKCCAESLFKLSYNNIEYVFVDDCSKDKSLEILEVEINKKYKNKDIKIIRHTTNQGLAGARLTGLLHATGDYVWFVDSDDYVETNTIEKCLPKIEAGSDLVVFNYYSKYVDKVERSLINSICINDVLFHNISPSIWKCIVKKDLFYKNNIFPVKGINHAEDFLLLARLVLVAQKPMVVNYTLYHYNCTNPSSYMANIKVKSIEEEIRATVLVSKFYKDYFSKHSLKNKYNKYKSALSYMLSYSYMRLYFIDSQNIKLHESENEIKRTSYFAFCLLQISKFTKNRKIIKILKKL